jgi:ectoine hydroxylase-related dioxygenase (phytanoyl-CoA dioxygenase family)
MATSRFDATDFNKRGFAIIQDVVDPNALAELINALKSADDDESIRRRGESKAVYAMRNLLQHFPRVRALAESHQIRTLIEDIDGSTATPVRGLLFDKTPEANWKVFWHQDVVIPVKQKLDSPGFVNWSIKAGVQYVEPPSEILESMVAIRIHLDDSTEQNGPLNVLPGSHLGGRLNAKQIAEAQAEIKPFCCTVPAGGVLLMRPLLLHASSPARVASHRRVIHIEYATKKLPSGLEWLVS